MSYVEHLMTVWLYVFLYEMWLYGYMSYIGCIFMDCIGYISYMGYLKWIDYIIYIDYIGYEAMKLTNTDI
jgi:hypothetical protein